MDELGIGIENRLIDRDLGRVPDGHAVDQQFEIFGPGFSGLVSTNPMTRLRAGEFNGAETV